MVSGWRRAFCTSITKEKSDNSATSTTRKTEKHQSGGDNSYSPRISSKLGFFSNPSTPRFLQQQQQQQQQSEPSSHVPTLNLRCRTTIPTSSSSSLPNSPKTQSKPTTPTKKFSSPRQLFQYLSSSNTNSNPSSPRSPSTFSLLKSTLHPTSRNRCGICMHSVKSGQGTAIFTAECNHVFHFPCVTATAQVKYHQTPNVQIACCPVCGSPWSEPPLLTTTTNKLKTTTHRDDIDDQKKHLRVYDDDEPLMSPSPGSLFVPIPELDDENDTQQEFQGFFVNPTPLTNTKTTPEVVIFPESAIVSSGKTHETRVVMLKVRAPSQSQSPSPSRGIRRPPIDLVALLDVSEHMSGVKSLGLKRAVCLIISSLGPTDRFSIVAFSSTSKRLFPLRRMTPSGKRSAKRIVDALGVTGCGMSANDALKKAVKVIEDRSEKNPLASVVVISSTSTRSSSTFVSTTRFFSHVEIPVHFISLGESETDALSKCVSVVLTVMFRDVTLQLGFASGSAPAEISAVYQLTGRAGVFGPGSVRVGDLHPGEERYFLVELKVPVSFSGTRHVLSVRPYFKEPSTQETIACNESSVLVLSPPSVRSSGNQRLRNVHVTTRAIAESRSVLERTGDVSGAYHLLFSARALLMQSADGSAGDCLRGLEAELAELHRHSRQNFPAAQEQMQRRQPSALEEKPEFLTQTSAWRAAERLAKVAIMRKHMNKVSDLHGFENARF